MLVSLHIRQFALMESVDLELGTGMTVFTGETGAGKSILVDALGAVFGTRASADWVRHGADKAEIMAIWEGQNEDVARLLEAHDLDMEDQLILRRIIRADGRSRCFINGIPVPARILRELGNRLLDLHGQHEHQALLQQDFQRQLLDAQLPQTLLQQMEQAFRRWQSLKEKLNRLRQQKNKAVEQAEWMRHELEQLKALAPRAGLAEQLEDTVEKGRRHAQLQQAAAQALAMLDEAEPNARFLMGQAMHALRAMSDYDDDLARAYELVVQADALLEEAAPSLRLVRDTEFDEETLQADEERRMALHEAMRRHQTDEEGLIRLMERLESDLSLAETADWEESRLEEELHEAERAYLALANQLHEQRMQAADKLMHLMRPHLDALALQGMQVRFHILAQPSPEHWTTHGFDRIHLEVMANPGEPWRALNTTISGGELSRFVLALKGCHAMQNAPPIAVFDEVDTGVGGEIGWHIGRVLSAMGQTRQVLVISHLPQVAACADHHVHIEKQTQDQRTVSRLRVLNADERVDELARMLGGGDARALEHAHAMLRAARAT